MSKVTAEWHIETGNSLRQLRKSARSIIFRVSKAYGVSSRQSKQAEQIESAILRLADRLDCVSYDEHGDAWSSRWYYGVEKTRDE